MTTTPSHTVSRGGARSMAQVSLFAALMAVMGLIPKIDLPFGVPITIQSLGVMLAGVMLGPWRGLQSMALFLLAAGLTGFLASPDFPAGWPAGSPEQLEQLRAAVTNVRAALQEAMATGLPIVATDVGGNAALLALGDD